MNILQLTKFYPPVLGGIETITYELAEGSYSRGHDVSVLCANTGRRTVRDTYGSVDVVRAGAYAKILSTSLAPALIRELTKARDSHEIIHVHLPNPMANLALRLVKPSSKIVLHWHSDIINQTHSLKLYEPLQRWMLKSADAIIATSVPYVEHSPWLQEHLAKVHVVPLGIRVSPLESATSELAHARELVRIRHNNRPMVFSVGRMATYKGFDVLINASRSVRSDAIVVVAGCGELLEVHRRRVRDLGLEHRIVFLGRLSDVDVAAYMAEASVFCLPSTNRAEAFGVVLLEAMAAGLPIVTTEIAGSGVPWVNEHGNTGFNVPVNDPASLADAINVFLDDRVLAQKFGGASRCRVELHFTSEVMVDKTIEVYRKIL